MAGDFNDDASKKDPKTEKTKASDATVFVDLKTITKAAPRGVNEKLGMLQFVEGPDTGKIVSLELIASTIVGRSTDSQIFIDDVTVSRKHAQITRLGQNDFALMDLGSSNGTFLNGKRLSPNDAQPLKSGDKILFGKTATVLFSIVDAEDANLQLKLYNQATRDALTGAYNRHQFETQLAREISHFQRNQVSLGMLLFDIDFFKKINDTFGHPGGDAVLVEVAKRIEPATRKDDLFARVGGEEFAVFNRYPNQESIAIVAERIRKAMEAAPVVFQNKVIPFTCSVGYTFVPADRKDIDAATIVKLADDALYEAKKTGRNRVCFKAP